MYKWNNVLIVASFLGTTLELHSVNRLRLYDTIWHYMTLYDTRFCNYFHLLWFQALRAGGHHMEILR